MVRIKDIADQLGVSATTVSNVIHGRTNRVSKETIKKVNEALSKGNYVPNMGGVLLSQNNSKIIGVVLNNDMRYENKILQNPFIVEIISALEENIRNAGFFTMLYNANSIVDVAKIATMWNVSGLIVFGFMEEDYLNLRDMISTPFVSIDGTYSKESNGIINVGIDDYNGAYNMGKYLISKGHKDILFLSDNDDGCDNKRKQGLKKAMKDAGLKFTEHNHRLIPAMEISRKAYYPELLAELKKHKKYTALFFASDLYAIEAMNYFMDNGLNVPGDISIAGFDDIKHATIVRPCLTTVRQNMPLKAAMAVNALLNIIHKYKISTRNVVLPVDIVERDSVASLKEGKQE